MKPYFLKLFNYDQFANKAILKTIMDAGEPEQAIKLIAHLLSAQQVWIKRCKGRATVGSILWPDWKANTLEKIIDDNHLIWIDFINGLKPGDFDSVIAYKSLNGDSYNSELNDIMAHVINHGTHHRAQAGQQLKLVGIENLPITDYIFYTR